ncbi:hypothetical protein PoB_007663300 [Plakobranchus ocellatus]|uniref:Uncharacterized protein n=1 Tax=Plakobranchus ocellatus TaxID=259542 RepID=A0AAV4E0K6_9GAST|nr:hypothetical protein PoB_007663300 [Plakobranchus ocellatus]
MHIFTQSSSSSALTSKGEEAGYSLRDLLLKPERWHDALTDRTDHHYWSLVATIGHLWGSDGRERPVVKQLASIREVNLSCAVSSSG